MAIRYITTNTYYDSDMIDNPISNYIRYSDLFAYLPGHEIKAELRIIPSEVNFLNGSKSMVYDSVDSQAVNYFHNQNSITMFYLQVIIDPHYYIYKEFYDYQPQFNSSRRRLDGSCEVSLHNIFVLLILLFHFDLLKLVKTTRHLSISIYSEIISFVDNLE